MRNHLVGLLLIGGLAGCTSDWDTDRQQTVQTMAPSPASATRPTVEVARGANGGFASLPDRGELMQYAKDRSVRKAGAYTYHPVSISEAHALNAIGKGELQLSLPNGRPLNIQYDRFEEQADGNWSWIGRNEDGSSAVLTFGDKAVFGHIDHGNAHYRIRTDRAGAWIVETDPLLAAGMSRAQRESRADYLLPPSGGGQLAASAHSQKAVSAEATGNEKAMAVVDVLLGYSNGLAARIGSQSGATTYLVSLIAATNNAYANSGVTMRVRVVHAMQVNYADTSSNKDALQGMTGYNADTQQQIPVVAAFNDLRAARETYGADLVALVRNYQEPQQNGCGIAWLLGMDQTEITAAADAPFGYAVVSDGSDRDEGDGNTYFCSTYALAHELGHLMGQAHNTQDSGGNAGRHAYSYGYRENSSAGFFTIMAYPLDDTQARDGEAPHFANPAVNFAGRPTGVANQSDNTRSLNITMPIIATFRATQVPLGGIPNDFNNDGSSDILWRNIATGQNAIWRSGNNATQQTIAAVSSLAWTVVGVGDFNADGNADILWRNTSSGQNTIWLSGNNATQQATTTVANKAWSVAGVGDFDGDGRADILWRNPSTGANEVWRSGNNATKSVLARVHGTAWRVVGIGDFDGDGRDDILWRNSTTGANSIWRGASSATQQTIAAASVGWSIVGVGDFDGDGRDDILWRNFSSGQNTIWRSGNSATQSAVAPVANAAWEVVGVGDFNGDGFSDILWRNRSTGQNTIWRSANNATQQAVATVGSPQSWRVVGF